MMWTGQQAMVMSLSYTLKTVRREAGRGILVTRLPRAVNPPLLYFSTSPACGKVFFSLSHIHTHTFLAYIYTHISARKQVFMAECTSVQVQQVLQQVQTSTIRLVDTCTLVQLD